MTTSAQAHLALAILRGTPPPPDTTPASSMADAISGTLYRNAAELLRATLSDPDWSGASESCAPFGSIAEESAATIQNLQSALDVRDSMLGVLEVAAQSALRTLEQSPVNSTVAAAGSVLREALERVGAMAAGVPSEALKGDGVAPGDPRPDPARPVSTDRV